MNIEPNPLKSPEEFRWAPFENNPSVWRRRACGSENLSGNEAGNEKGQNDIFISTTVRFGMQTASSEIIMAVERLWRELRFQHPEMACNPVWDEDKQCFLEYRVPQSEHEVDLWCRNSICLQSSGNKSVSEIHQDIEEARIGSSKAAAIVLDISDEDCRILFHFNHLFFDGVGACLLVGKFFNVLTAEWPRLSKSDYLLELLDWSETVDRLSPPYFEFLDSNITELGSELDAAVGDLLTATGGNTGSWGLKPADGSDGSAITQTYDFTTEESGEIGKAIKQKLGSDYTITHLTQMAVVLATLKKNPPTPETDSAPFFASFIVFNDRKFMGGYHTPGGEPFFGNCNSHGTLILDNIQEHALNEKITNAEQWGKIKYLTKLVKEGYEKATARPLRVPSALLATEAIAHMISKLPFSSSGSTRPLLTSDGLYDRYIPSQYNRPGETTTFLTINELSFFTNNFISYPAIRVSSYRGRMRLSVDYNGKAYADQEMEDFLKDIADLMRRVLD